MYCQNKLCVLHNILPATIMRFLGYSRRRGSLVRTSVSGWQTSLDLCLICGKGALIGQLTRPTQSSIHSGSVNE